jgi:hypothetical protein
MPEECTIMGLVHFEEHRVAVRCTRNDVANSDGCYLISGFYQRSPGFNLLPAIESPLKDSMYQYFRWLNRRLHPD